MKACIRKYILNFKRPSGTSRGVLTHKETWFLILREDDKFGIGECALLKGLSADDVPEYEEMLQWACAKIGMGETWLLHELRKYPSIQFGVEQAFRSLASRNPFLLFQSDFTTDGSPISINGLIWMGNFQSMHQQLQQKLAEGFSCIKIKIGALDFNSELQLLSSVRDEHGFGNISLRVDANGAFTEEQASQYLAGLTPYGIHSIEQPIPPGNWGAMQRLCRETPVPIALDEELIGVFNLSQKEELLKTIRPQYLVLKPSLLGGFAGSLEWITLAEKLGIGWWVTSALESNIGLNAIAQWVYTLKNDLPQGLGTGGLFTNNLDCPLHVAKGNLYYRNNQNWSKNLIKELCI